MRLEHSLVLNGYFHGLLGARGLEDLKRTLGEIEEGPGSDDQSRFFHALAGLKGLRLSGQKLREYDARVVDYEARLSKARGAFAFKYFQYLALLYTEIFLDRLTDDPAQFLRELNTFLDRLKEEEIGLREFPAFASEDLRRIAFFMATGSGKTLLLHVNLWQVLYYLELGRHPEALVQRADQRREFDMILLITPNEGLSRQHLEEFQLSGVDAALLVQDRMGRGIFGPRVRVVEIHKLAEEPSKEGVSVLLDELRGANLVFVDEGHKGTGSEAQTWKRRQRRLSAEGFLVEYSATFAQSIGAASRKVQEDLLAEYGKAILFDYSYRHFYDDGYGKDFRVLNLARARETQAQDLLLGGLLAYYQQARLFENNETQYRPYNLERPLWVFLGSSVNAVYSQEGRKRSDVATVVAFLKRFLEEPAWAVKGIRRILRGESGFTDRDSGDDLFAPHLGSLKGIEADTLYKQIARDVFHGRGGLEVWELKAVEGELALRVSAPEGRENPYFGVINIGDVSTFKKHLVDTIGIEVREDRFIPSLFSEVNAPDSRVNVLIGAKKFIEGWSSWRVSVMGLFNMGKGEGPQVIQLFGRGVRLKGKHWTLKRSAALPEDAPHPDGLDRLETLCIFGWNADYIQAFRQMLEQEDIPRELLVPVKSLFDPWPKLPVPKPKAGYRVESETWTLSPEPLNVSADLTPQVTAMAGLTVGTARLGERIEVDFSASTVTGLLDLDFLYTHLLEYKAARRYGNVYVPRSQMLPILRASTLYMLREDLHDPSRLEEGAAKVLKTYLDRYFARKEREAESKYLKPGLLLAQEQVARYTIRVSSQELLREIEALIRDPDRLYSDGGKPLPRLHVEKHLFSPLLLHPEGEWAKDISVTPPGLREGEAKLVKDLRDFWEKNHARGSYHDLEIFLARNFPRVGVGFFRRSGFYPDFILWIKERKRKRTTVQFLEPHGLHHGGLAGNHDRFEALSDLQRLSKEPPFLKKRISMTGYLLTETALQHIPDAAGRSWESLEQDYPLLRQAGGYIQKILNAGE